MGRGGGCRTSGFLLLVEEEGGFGGLVWWVGEKGGCTCVQMLGGGWVVVIGEGCLGGVGGLVVVLISPVHVVEMVGGVIESETC